MEAEAGHRAQPEKLQQGLSSPDFRRFVRFRALMDDIRTKRGLPACRAGLAAVQSRPTTPESEPRGQLTSGGLKL